MVWCNIENIAAITWLEQLSKTQNLRTVNITLIFEFITTSIIGAKWVDLAINV